MLELGSESDATHGLPHTVCYHTVMIYIKNRSLFDLCMNYYYYYYYYYY